MKKFKMILTPVLLLCLTLILTACGCEHDWRDATCLEPKTCTLCGVTEGETIEHNYMSATCDEPQRCLFCDTTKGTAKGHNYSNGYCINCSSKDPNYTDLRNFGFQNTYGMNLWLEVTGYDFGENIVLISKGSSKIENLKLRFYIFYGNYYQEGNIAASVLKSIESITADLMEDKTTYTYNIINNDVISVRYGTGSINKRAVDSNNSMLVMETVIDNNSSYRSSEHWFVPADLLDFSTIELYEVNENRINPYKYSIKFKKNFYN